MKSQPRFQNNLSPMSVFSIGLLLNFQSLVNYLKISKKNRKKITQPMLDNSILGVITQRSS